MEQIKKAISLRITERSKNNKTEIDPNVLIFDETSYLPSSILAELYQKLFNGDTKLYYEFINRMCNTYKISSETILARWKHILEEIDHLTQLAMTIKNEEKRLYFILTRTIYSQHDKHLVVISYDTKSTTIIDKIDVDKKSFNFVENESLEKIMNESSPTQNELTYKHCTNVDCNIDECSLRCSVCGVYYCTQSCQKEDRKRHIEYCKYVTNVKKFYAT
jgi:hypothetical protein